MKPIKDLSQSELFNLVYNTFGIRYDAEAECAACGSDPNAEYTYICDRCEAALTDKDPKRATEEPNENNHWRI